MDRTTAERELAAARACERLRIESPEHRAAVAEAYQTVRDHTAPFIMESADRLAVDLWADLARNPDARVLFLGRDGAVLLAAARELHPRLPDHCSQATVSRPIAEAAVQDLELHQGRSFPELAAFRSQRGEVDPVTVPGARMRLRDMLYDRGVPVGRRGAEIILVDTSFKGTVQELLAAAYPATSFQGRYLFHGASPHDPHPGTKRGYALHWEVGDGSLGYPVSELPAEPDRLFAHQDAVAAVEDLLHGPRTSAQSIVAAEPDQEPARMASDPLRGLNPERVSPRYADPSVREAVCEVALLAVSDAARHTGERRAAGEDVAAELARGAARYRNELSAWIAGRPRDPRFGELLDSFARRADKQIVAELAAAIQARQLSADQARAIWAEYDRRETLAERRFYVGTTFPLRAEAGKVREAADRLSARDLPGQRRSAETVDPRRATDIRDEPDDRGRGRSR